MKPYLFFFLSIGFTALLSAQRAGLLNPSFEDAPRHSQVPGGWWNCGDEHESPPDIQPDLTFQVITRPYAGNTYLGMVTRDNGTKEAVGASLTELLRVNNVYRFSLALAQSEGYYSLSRATGQPANYVAPVVLKIWGANRRCERTELLAQSPVIDHLDWQIYTFLIRPRTQSYTYIILEVDYPDHVQRHTNGNLLLDAASAFTPINAEEAAVLTAANEDAAATRSAVVTITGENYETSPDRREPSEVTVLQLPNADYFADEASLRTFVSNALDDLVLRGNAADKVHRFRLADEERVRGGHPAWYAVQYALTSVEAGGWELVVYDEIPERADQRVLALARQLNGNDLRINIVPYDAELHDGARWYCMSIANGWYLLKR